MSKPFLLAQNTKAVSPEEAKARQEILDQGGSLKDAAEAAKKRADEKVGKAKQQAEDNKAKQEKLSQLPSWNCRVENSPVGQAWTVGEIMDMTCEGPTAEILSEKLSFKEEKKSGYELFVLKVQSLTNNKIEMLVTSYVPAKHDFNQMYLLDQGVEVVKVEPLTLPLASVNTEQRKEPYPPNGPILIGYPTWLWIGLLIVVLGTVFFGFFRLNRRAQMRRVIEELKQHNTALGAFNQFNKDIRLLGRKHVFGKDDSWSEQQKHRYVENLDEIFRMYLLREFYVPALDWNSGLVLKTISNQDKKRYDRYSLDLRKFLKELDRAKEDSDKLRVHDCKQLTQMAKRVTQSIWKVRKI